MMGRFTARVVFLSDYPVDDRDARRFGIAELQQAGLNVEVWDLSHFYFPKSNELAIKTPNWVNLTKYSSIQQLKVLSETLTSNDVVVFLGCLHASQFGVGRKVLELISKTPAWLASVWSGSIPSPFPQRSSLHPLNIRRLQHTAQILHPRRWKTKANRLYLEWLQRKTLMQRRFHYGKPIRPLDQIWAGTDVDSIAKPHIGPSTSISYIHALDYELILTADASADDRSTSPLVFIDSMGPLHPDYIVQERESGIRIEAYSDLICRGLDEIEKQFGVRVLIAAHPRASKGVMEPWYGGRSVYYGQTAALIKESKAVIVADGSTAIGIAAVFCKPLILLDSVEFDPLIQRMNEAFSHALSVPLVDLNSCRLPRISLEVNEVAYTRYVERYVKRSGTPEKPFWSVVASDIISRLN